MKKIIITVIVVFMNVVSAFAGDTYKVRLVNIRDYSHGIEIVCEGGKCLYSIPNTNNYRFYNFFISLRSGDIIEIEEYENRLMGIRKVGHESPSYNCNGGVVDNRNGWYTGGYGYTGSAHVGYSNGKTNVGVSTYSNGNGSTVVEVGGTVAGFNFNVPVKVTKKSTRRTAPTTTTTTTTTRTVPVKTVKTVQTTTSTSTTTSAAVLYNASTLTEMF